MSFIYLEQHGERTGISGICVDPVKRNLFCLMTIFQRFRCREPQVDGICMCPYRITYYIKFLLYWAESPRDHVDALLSFKYQPTISINDMPHMVARHGNLCTYDKMFFLYKDRVADPSFSNMQGADRLWGIDCGV